jgi:hypothetical protein
MPNNMRKVASTYHGAGQLWVVEFDDQSRIAVCVSGTANSDEKTAERIKSAAIIFSESHPEGVLSSVMVNLSGEKINLRPVWTDEDRNFLTQLGISID